MGCDIHSYAERKTDKGYEVISGLHPFDWRSYGMFGFLAGVRNYSAVPVLSEPRGIPDDVSADVKKEAEGWSGDGHSHSWLTVDELLSWDYDAEVEDRRYTRQEGPNSWNGAATCEAGQGHRQPWREFLGEAFMNDLGQLRIQGASRVIFWFDN